MFAVGWSPGYIPASATEADNNDTESLMLRYLVLRKLHDELDSRTEEEAVEVEVEVEVLHPLQYEVTDMDEFDF